MTSEVPLALKTAKINTKVHLLCAFKLKRKGENKIFLLPHNFILFFLRKQVKKQKKPSCHRMPEFKI